MDQAKHAQECFLDLQHDLEHKLLTVDPTISVSKDSWQRKEGGGGRTWAVSEGKVIEKGGINFSDVCGEELPPTATQNRPELAGSKFRAMGVSVVFHPLSPHVPTAHANVRYFEASPKNKEKIWWFGGGFDLTPYYPVYEDVISWHRKAKATCEPFGAELYPKFKNWCDEYFTIPHRKETRGVGGIFFDDLVIENFHRSLEFVQKVGQNFGDAYFEIVNKRKNKPFTTAEKEFQLYRRGRYVEFNLVYDRGTHFGLQSKGRVESILMSMPPLAKWSYQWSPEKGSIEEDLYNNYLTPRDWLSENAK
jgi:coproporphyrinogen III oxidase